MFFFIFIITILLIIFPFITFFCHIWQYKWCLYCKKLTIKNKEFNLCIDKILFTNFSKDTSKRNAILLFFFIVLIILTFILNAYNIFLSEKILNEKHNYNLSQFWNSIKANYKYFFIPLDLLIIASYISSFSINKFSEKVFPLKDGIDVNSKEQNTIVRFGTWCEIINNLSSNSIKPTAIKIGQEFGKKLEINFLNLKIENDLKILEKKWNKTDSDLARFYKRIIITPLNSSEISLEIFEPFWNRNFHFNCQFNLSEYPKQKGRQPIKCLHPLCVFNYHYIEGVLSNTKGFEELSIKCLQNDRKCYLFTDKRCFFTIKIK